MLGAELQRVDHAEHLVEIAPHRHRIDQDELDLLVGADDEDVAHRLVVGRRALQGIAGNLGRQHVVELGDGEIGVADHRIIGCRALRLRNVLRPLRMAVHRIDGKADDLHMALVEFRLELGHGAELRRADGREILRVREQDAPGLAQPGVEIDPAFGGVGIEIGRGVADAQGHGSLRHVATFASLAEFRAA